MSSSTFLAFWAVSILFVMSPGADWAYAITAGLKNRAVLPAVSGMVLGHLVAILIVAAGVGVLVTRTPGALTGLTLAGSAYLVWLGINMIAHPPLLGAGAEQENGAWTRWAIKGFGVSSLNPKVHLLFLALLPRFTDPALAWPIPVQITALGSIHVVSCTAIYLLVGYGAQIVLRTQPGIARLIGRGSGIAMILIAVVLTARQIPG